MKEFKLILIAVFLASSKGISERMKRKMASRGESFPRGLKTRREKATSRNISPKVR